MIEWISAVVSGVLALATIVLTRLYTVADRRLKEDATVQSIYAADLAQIRQELWSRINSLELRIKEQETKIENLQEQLYKKQLMILNMEAQFRKFSEEK